MLSFNYDLAVIGSGPSGHHAAIQGAKLRKRVILIERRPMVGGTCINLGTIPSKAIREAAIYLSGYREHAIYGESYKVKEKITLRDLLFRVEPVVRHEVDVARAQLLRNGVDLVHAEATLVDAHTIRLKLPEGGAERLVTTETIVIAVGTRAAQDPNIPLDGTHVFSSDDILTLDELPQSLTVIGGGVIGCEYASVFAELGVRVTLIDMRPRLLPFVDAEMIEALSYHLRERRVTLRLGEKVDSVEIVEHQSGVRVKTTLASGKQIVTEKALCSTGRQGATETLNLGCAGLSTDRRGLLKVNQFYQTSAENIYAVGDIIGFPSLASTSMEQGRLAVCHAFKLGLKYAPEFVPYGIYTIPEISFVGYTEDELTERGVPYEIGKAQYREIARGQIVGDTIGRMKLILNRDTRDLLGVHIIGQDAVELVHIGQAVLSLKGKIDYFVETVFNYPTLAECYKTAALDGINRLIS